MPTWIGPKATLIKLNGTQWGFGELTYPKGASFVVSGESDQAGAEILLIVTDKQGNNVWSGVVGSTDKDGNISGSGTFDKVGNFFYNFHVGHTEGGQWYNNTSAMVFGIKVEDGRTSSDVNTNVNPMATYVAPKVSVVDPNILSANDVNKAGSQTSIQAVEQALSQTFVDSEWWNKEVFGIPIKYVGVGLGALALVVFSKSGGKGRW